MKKLLVLSVFFVLAHSCLAQDINKGVEAYQAGDYATALKELKPYADQGNANAQLSLGVMYANGEGVLKDYAEALKWYQLSADQGNAMHNTILDLCTATVTASSKTTKKL